MTNKERLLDKAIIVKDWLDSRGWLKVRKLPDRLAAEWTGLRNNEKAFTTLFYELMDEIDIIAD
jgi:hypothetical protein